jgi:hypothetical protein
MDVSEVYVLDIIGRVVVSDLPSCPIQTFNLNNFVVCNFGAGWD